jgi:hypothetical protein
MSSNAFVVGWRVIRGNRSQYLDQAKLRRRTVTGGLVAVAFGGLLVIANIFWIFLDESVFQNTVVVGLFAAALGSISAAFQNVGRLPTSSPQPPLGDWRRSERIDRQFAARPPAMLTEDRDEVIVRAERSVGPSVAGAERFIWIPAGWVLAWLGLLISGYATADKLTLLLIPPVFALLQSGTFVAIVTGAGRADIAHRRARELPPAPPREPPTQRKIDPRGSKLELPDS